LRHTLVEIRKYLELLVDPSSGKTLEETHAIKHIGYDEEKDTIVLLIELSTKALEFTAVLNRQIAKIVKLDLGYKGVLINYEQARIEGLAKQLRILGIASGKGGVGKSTITANLAYALKASGKNVGIIDADIYGSNMPKIFDVEGEELIGSDDGQLYPLIKDGIELVSAAFLMGDQKVLMWRGPMLGKILDVFFKKTMWSSTLDYLLIDLPPGTGDVMMDIKNLVPDAKILIITTPHISAASIAIKAGFAAKELKQDIIGVVENMSYYQLDGLKHYLFGQGGGETVAKTLGIKLIASIPIGQPISGHHSIFTSTEPIGIIYLHLAKAIMDAWI
jgi:ATP-binding protein involved in chromosome partitioning